MPDYTVVLSGKAQKQLDKLSDNVANPIITAISDLERNPRPGRIQKIEGTGRIYVISLLPFSAPERSLHMAA